MCRFARNILKKTSHVTKELEVTLGPDTGDLDLCIGVHSCSVTAGVLRGAEKARLAMECSKESIFHRRPQIS
jgi:hypothetical protein